jgi:hypothetical protein
MQDIPNPNIIIVPFNFFGYIIVIIPNILVISGHIFLVIIVHAMFFCQMYSSSLVLSYPNATFFFENLSLRFILTHKVQVQLEYN